MALASVARMQGGEIDRLRLHDVATVRCAAFVDSLGDSSNDWQSVLARVAEEMDIRQLHTSERPDPARLPAITWNAESGWLIVRAQGLNGTWQIQDSLGQIMEVPVGAELPCVRLQFEHETVKASERPAFKLFKEVFKSHRAPLWEAGIATAMISLMALGVSLFSMQVYDRVIPTQGYQTLWVLTFGVGLSLLFDLLLKNVRSNLMEDSVVQMDRQTVSRYLRPLAQGAFGSAAAFIGLLVCTDSWL